VHRKLLRELVHPSSLPQPLSVSNENRSLIYSKIPLFLEMEMEMDQHSRLTHPLLQCPHYNI
jgi:hypothetical protein